MWRWLITGAAGIALLTETACGNGVEDGAVAGAGDGRLQVVAAFYPLAEAAAEVGGDRVDVVNLTPAGSEPHDLELTPDQLDRLDDADLVVYLGGGFQPAIEEAVERSDVDRLDVTNAVRLTEDDEGDEGAVDPHFWLDPTRQADAVTAVEDALTDFEPGGGDAFAANADAYRAELDLVDSAYRHGLASCARREIVTAHAAFHYLAERYGLEQLAITGISPESEPDPERIADLADLVAERGVTTVFHEPLVPAELAEALAREAGVDTAVLDPIEGLSDEAIEDGASYVTVMDDNLAALREALGCQ